MITLGLIKIMLDHGFYSTMKLDPIDYHGYRETIQNLTDVIEEIEVEMLLKPDFKDKLTITKDKLQKRLDTLTQEKLRNMPAVNG